MDVDTTHTVTKKVIFVQVGVADQPHCTYRTGIPCTVVAVPISDACMRRKTEGMVLISVAQTNLEYNGQ